MKILSSFEVSDNVPDFRDNFKSYFLSKIRWHDTRKENIHIKIACHQKINRGLPNCNFKIKKKLMNKTLKTSTKSNFYNLHRENFVKARKYYKET